MEEDSASVEVEMSTMRMRQVPAVSFYDVIVASSVSVSRRWTFCLSSSLLASAKVLLLDTGRQVVGVQQEVAAMARIGLLVSQNASLFHECWIS